MDDDKLMVFSGSASRNLTAGICQHLGIAISAGDVHRFSEGNIFVRVREMSGPETSISSNPRHFR